MLALHHNESVALCSLQGVLYYVVCVYTRLQQCRDQVSFSKAQTSGFEIALLHENFPLCVCVLQLCLLPTPLFYTCKYAKEHPKNSHEDQPNNPDWDLPPRRCHTLSTCIILNLRYTYLLSWCLKEVLFKCQLAKQSFSSFSIPMNILLCTFGVLIGTEGPLLDYKIILSSMI